MIWKTQPRSSTRAGLQCVQSGTGPSVVLVHGVGLRAESWNAVQEKLSSRYTVYSIDMPGHGERAGLAGDNLSLANYTEWLAAMIAKFEAPVILVGHSMGALIALDVATKHPELVSKVVACNAIYNRSKEASVAIKKRAVELANTKPEKLDPSTTLKRWFGASPNGENLEISKACENWLRTTDIKQYALAYSIFANEDGVTEAALKEMNVPALFLTGSDEPNSTPEMSLSMASVAPNGEAYIVKNAAHITIMTHADEVADALGDFFVRLEIG